MDYGILERVAAGKEVFIDYKNGVMPQIRIKYMKGEKSLIHLASHRLSLLYPFCLQALSLDGLNFLELVGCLTNFSLIWLDIFEFLRPIFNPFFKGKS